MRPTIIQLNLKSIMEKVPKLYQRWNQIYPMVHKSKIKCGLEKVYLIDAINHLATFFPPHNILSACSTNCPLSFWIYLLIFPVHDQNMNELLGKWWILDNFISDWQELFLKVYNAEEEKLKFKIWNWCKVDAGAWTNKICLLPTFPCFFFSYE